LRELVNTQDLPKVYGGELPWVYEDEPSLDGGAKAVLKDMPKGPVVFANGEASKPT